METIRTTWVSFASMETGVRSAIRRLALARFVSLTGGAAANVALAYTIFAKTQSPFWLSASFLLTFGITGVLTPFAGAISDRFSRRRVMVASELLGGVAFLVLFTVDTPLTMIVMGFVASIVRTPFAPASAASIPNLAGDANLSWANSLVALSTQAGNVLGPGVGGLLLAALGAHAVFGINAVSFVLSALLIARIHGSFEGQEDEKEAEDGGTWAGFRAVFHDPVLRSIGVSWALMWLAINVTFVADVPLAAAFGVGAIGYGLIDVFGSGGAVIGSVVARRITPTTEGVVLLSGTVAVLVGYTLVALAPWFAMVLGGVALALGFDAFAEVAGYGIIQRRTSDTVRGRVFAALTTMGLLANVVAFSAAGFVVELVGPRGVYAIGAGTAALATLILVPAFRGVRP